MAAGAAALTEISQISDLAGWAIYLSELELDSSCIPDKLAAHLIGLSLERCCGLNRISAAGCCPRQAIA